MGIFSKELRRGEDGKWERLNKDGEWEKEKDYKIERCEPPDPPLPEYMFVSEKLLFYLKNKTKITFRLKVMPEYFYTGTILSINNEYKDRDYCKLIFELENKEKMLFFSYDILDLSIHPASINPIKIFQRTDIPEVIRKMVFERCNNKCEIKTDYCTGDATEIDHVIPISLGGSNELYNLQGACSSCNKRKSNKL